MLPVKLPENVNLKTKGNPLDKEKMEKIFINGQEMTRETDTLDTFVCSSWYYLRFCSPKRLIMVLIKRILIIGCSRPVHRRCRTCNFTFVIFAFFYESH